MKEYVGSHLFQLTVMLLSQIGHQILYLRAQFVPVDDSERTVKEHAEASREADGH